MAQERLTMRKIAEVLRLKWERGLSNRAIARSCSISYSTVAEYLQRAQEAGLSWPLPPDLGEDTLFELLFPEASPSSSRVIPRPDWCPGRITPTFERSDPFRRSTLESLPITSRKPGHKCELRERQPPVDPQPPSRMALVLPALARIVAGIILLVADILVLLGYLLFVLTIRENRYASRVVEVEDNQVVVTTGPYSLVRHPMYLAVSVIFGLTPLALGSYWALVPAMLLPAVLVSRIRNEEQLLRRNLAGYQEYCQKVKYRLLPFIW